MPIIMTHYLNQSCYERGLIEARSVQNNLNNLQMNTNYGVGIRGHMLHIDVNAQNLGNDIEWRI